MKERSPIQRVGKEFVIVVVVVFSSLSFILGFFVGKKSGGNIGEYRSQSMALPQESEQARQNPASQEMPPGPPADGPEGDSHQTRATGRNDLPQPATEPISAVNGVADAKSQQVPKAAAMLLPDGMRKEKPAPPEVRPSEPAKGGAVYSVQLCALKNEAEAKRLKDTYARKGYPTYIEVVSGKNKEKIYKVKAGKFRDRKGAELLSVRLKKNGDLHPFVTGGSE